MKFMLTLFAVLAIIGLGQARQFPDFGSGPLHEDIQDFLDLVPSKEINKIALDYMEKDPEVKAAFNYIVTTTVIRDLMVDVEAIPEMINLMNYMQKEGVDIYYLVNEVNKALGIKELVPPSSNSYSALERTGGLAGLFKDIKKVIPFNKFIRTYVQKMRTSAAFVNFINQLKSNNFQRLVNKLYQGKSFQIIVNGLKSKGVNTQIVADVMYIVLGITVPNGVVYQERTVEEELMDFVQLIPAKFSYVVIKYILKDEKAREALLYMFKPEFHSILRDVEALKEHKLVVAYFEKAGLNVIHYIQSLHKAIDMEDYMPPKIKNIFESEIGIQKIGDGFKGMIDELYNILPIDQIDALYKQKLQNSKVFAEFISEMKSPEIQHLIYNLYVHETYRNFIMTTKENGLDLNALKKFVTRLLGFK